MRNDHGITYHEGAELDFAALAQLRRAEGWAALAESTLAEQVRGSRFVYTARVAGRLVGFVRAISDGVSNAYICGLIVDPEFRSRGVGSELVRLLVDGRPTIRWSLRANPQAHAFYARLGFVSANDHMALERTSG